MKNPLYYVTASAFLSLAALSAYAADNSSARSTDTHYTNSSAQSANATNADVDNTRVNKRDRNAGEPTADQAQNNRTDRDTMQQIRKALVHNKSLSTSAHNVKIIAENGRVTLKGPVRSDYERKEVEDTAIKVAGAGNVTNEISVKRPSANRRND